MPELCRICLLPFTEPSLGGPGICAWCDSGTYRDGVRWSADEAIDASRIPRLARIHQAKAEIHRAKATLDALAQEDKVPGPVSESYDPGRDAIAAEMHRWRENLERRGFHYFVLDIEDIFAALDPDEQAEFAALLDLYNLHRDGLGKPRRNYWVTRRDYRCGPAVKMLLEAELGIKLKE